MGGDRNRNIFRPFLETVMTSITLCPLLTPHLLFFLPLDSSLLFPAFHKLSMSLYLKINHRNTLLYLAVAQSLSDGFGSSEKSSCICVCDLMALLMFTLANRTQHVDVRGHLVCIPSKFRTIIQQIKKPWKLWKCFSDFLCQGDATAGVCLSDCWQNNWKRL